MVADPYISFVLILASIAWSLVGATFWAAFREEKPSQAWVTFLVIAGGPAVYGLAAYHGWLYLRRRILARFGVEGYTCCAGGKVRSGCVHRPTDWS